MSNLPFLTAVWKSRIGEWESVEPDPQNLPRFGWEEGPGIKWDLRRKDTTSSRWWCK